MTVEVPLDEVATIIRSKNAGPFRLTLDVLFEDRAVYEAARRSRVLSAERVAALYGVAHEDVTDHVEYDPAKAIKITIRRRVSAGSAEDTDVYGCQQHTPLLSITVPLEDALPDAQPI